MEEPHIGDPFDPKVKHNRMLQYGFGMALRRLSHTSAKLHTRLGEAMAGSGQDANAERILRHARDIVRQQDAFETKQDENLAQRQKIDPKIRRRL
ncbi:unnamed protein product, partial [Amoebophrya sp. A25]|eukprot:GSA25T00006428001.1